MNKINWKWLTTETPQLTKYKKVCMVCILVVGVLCFMSNCRNTNKMQNELSESIRESMKTQKQYFEGLGK